MKWPLAFAAGLIGWALAVRARIPWTLERSLDYALAHNPDARIAQQRIAAAQAGLEQANSTFWPRLPFNPATPAPTIRCWHSAASSISGLTALRLTSTTFPIWITSMRGASLPSRCMPADGISLGGKLPPGDHRSGQAGERCSPQRAGLRVSRAFHTVQKTRQFILAAEAAVNSLENESRRGQKASGWRHAVEVRRVGH